MRLRTDIRGYRLIFALLQDFSLIAIKRGSDRLEIRRQDLEGRTKQGGKSFAGITIRGAFGVRRSEDICDNKRGGYRRIPNAELVIRRTARMVKGQPEFGTQEKEKVPLRVVTSGMRSSELGGWVEQIN